jgi:hypothetical protein
MKSETKKMFILNRHQKYLFIKADIELKLIKLQLEIGS